MVDLTQKAKVAKAKKVKADLKASEALEREQKSASALEGFVSKFSDVVEGGISIDGLDSLSVACDRIEQFGEEFKTALSDISRSVESLHELDIPESVKVATIADERLIGKLEQLGDNGELLARVQSLDQAILLLTEAVEKAQRQGKRPEDYLPVRIVQGVDSQLSFITQLPFGGYSSGGGGGGNGSPYIDSTGKIVNVELTAGGEIPVSATLASSPEYIKLAGSDANERDSTYYGDGLTSGVMAVHERYFDGSAYNRTPASKVLVDKATTNIIYIGKAPIGTALGTGAWQIKKIDKTVTDNVTITFAAAGAFTATWNNRGSETYS